MIDLSNNNDQSVNFTRLYDSGQRRVYLKLTEGDHFLDHTAAPLFHRALAAKLKVGFYHFARPSVNTAFEEAQFFIRCLPTGWKKAGHTLRPCLDLEDPNCKPSKLVATWAGNWVQYVKKHTGLTPIIYGSPGYLEPCGFAHAPCELWLASYGRNDGAEHPFQIPTPWKRIVAHQYASTAHVAGVNGEVDLSHVFKPRLLDVTRLSK